MNSERVSESHVDGINAAVLTIRNVTEIDADTSYTCFLHNQDTQIFNLNIIGERNVINQTLLPL